tara:strand:+ start:494 stop:814 length:321 start_codon:yes stop_codon:yes gene_type:complete
MNKPTPHTITVTVADSSCDNKIEITLNKYSDLNDWIKVFKTILIHQTFCEDTVKELFEEVDYNDDYKEYPLPTAQQLNEIDYSARRSGSRSCWNRPIGKPVGKEAW